MREHMAVITPREISALRIAARFLDDLSSKGALPADRAQEMRETAACIQNVINKITAEKIN